MKNPIVKVLIIISIAVVFVLSVVLFAVQNKELRIKYSEAVAYAESGDYQTAYDTISNMGEYRDSEELAQNYQNEIEYEKAVSLMESGDYDAALEIFSVLNSGDTIFKDARDLANEAQYRKAIELCSEGDLDNAFIEFKNLPYSFKDTQKRLDELQNARNFIGKWYSKEYQIDMDITGKISAENITYLDVVISDRNGFLLGTEDYVLRGEDLVLDVDRFTWDMFDDGSRYAVQYSDNHIDIVRLRSGDSVEPVRFVRKLTDYSGIDGSLNDSMDDVDGGVR